MTVFCPLAVKLSTFLLKSAFWPFISPLFTVFKESINKEEQSLHVLIENIILENFYSGSKSQKENSVLLLMYEMRYRHACYCTFSFLYCNVVMLLHYLV